MKKEIFQAEVKLSRIFFPKNVTEVEGGNFAIFTASIEKDMENCSIFEIGLTERYSDKEFKIYETIKLKGNVCDLNFNDTYVVQFELGDTHEKWGNTYNIKLISKKVSLDTLEQQMNFISNIITNKDTVKELFDTYGTDVIKILENKDTKKLTKIRGIKEKTAKRLYDKYNKNRNLMSLFSEIASLDLSTTLINKLIKHYKSPDTVSKILTKDPYRLTEVRGIGFKKADEIAMKLGLMSCQDIRVKSCLMYILYEEGEKGKSYLHYSQLMDLLYYNLGYVSQEEVIKGCQLLVNSGDIVLTNDNQFVGLKKYFNTEKNIYNELLRLKNFKKSQNSISENKNLNRAILKQCEAEQGFDFTEEQINVINKSICHNVVAISGSAGVGKSTVARGILQILKSNDLSIGTCALSGKASVRITEATGFESATIHRTLGFLNGEFSFNEKTPLPFDVVLIDETTMVNGELFLSVLRALKEGAILILLGDIKQLTPIGSCQVFADILNGKLIYNYELTTIHRQARASGIITLSIQISEQKQFVESGFEGEMILGELQDMILDLTNEKGDCSYKVYKHFMQEYTNGASLDELQITSPTRSICYSINNQIQDMINPGSNSQTFKVKFDKDKFYTIKVGDKVINTKNLYNTTDIGGVPCPIYNGNMGIVKEIDKGNCIVEFVGIGTVMLEGNQKNNLELGYCCTIHKLQGSGFGTVIGYVDMSSYALLNAEMLYTLITRAKTKCILTGNTQAVRTAVSKRETKVKQTYLDGWLKEGIN